VTEPRDHLSDHLLGELTGDEQRRFDEALAADPSLADEVAQLAPLVERLEALDALAWDPPAPPPLPPDLVAPAARPSWWRRRIALRPLPVAVAATALIALGIVAGLLVGDAGDPDQGGRVVALAPLEPLGDGASGQVTFPSGGGQAEVDLAGLPPSRDGEFYELWLLNSADDLVSLGSFSVPASGQLHVSVPLPAGSERFAAIDLSVEPPDGNPAHSSRSLLRAPLSS
jgi:anti-sigma-K factor RskA